MKNIRTTLFKTDFNPELAETLMLMVADQTDLDSLNPTETYEAVIKMSASHLRREYMAGKVSDKYIASFDLFSKIKTEVGITFIDREIQKINILDTMH